MNLVKGRTLSTPSSMVFELFQALRRLCFHAHSEHEDGNLSASRQDAALCVFLSAQCVEIFMNVYFRILIEEGQFQHAQDRILDDLNRKISLEAKLTTWPEVVFGKKLDFGQGACQKFKELKNLRNHLSHFSSSHESVSLPGGVSFNGMADTTKYNSLSFQSAIDALNTAEEFLCEIFSLRGISPDQLPHMLHSWTGKMPHDANL